MAEINTYRAQRGLAPAATPNVAVDNTMAQAIQGLGSAISGMAADIQARNQKRANFEAENAYRRFGIEMEMELNNQAQNITPGGAGFHDKFLTEVYRPKRDAFLSSLPEDLRPRFETVLADETGADSAEWSTRAATVERDEMYRWTKQEVTLTHTQMAQAIALDPSRFEEYMAAGEELIASTTLPTPEQAKLRQEWRTMAQVASLDAMLQDDPQGVLRVLGVDTRNLSPGTQFSILSRAVQWQESTDNPNAISPKGAVGLMQVMPSTAKDIARALGDERFPHGENDTVITAYLSNPVVNKRYGEEYLRQQLRTFAATRDPVATALVAYNGGPSVAQRWVESGYDDRVLPAETREYKNAIMASISAPTAPGTPGAVRFTNSGGNEPADLDGVSQDLISRVNVAWSSLGLDNVRINSGHRTHAENAAAGGAEESQHLKGGALDINVAGIPHAKRVEIIRALSAAGVTGIGVGANIIHADIGGRRAWGYATSAGGGEVPAWAKGVITEHLNNAIPPTRAVATAYGDLPYGQRQAYLARADQQISQQHAAMTRATSVQKVEVRRAMDNEIATVRTTGAPSGQFDETLISTVLGEDEYLKYVDTLDKAQRTYTATHDIATLRPDEMEQRYLDYAPIPGTPDFAKQQEVQAAVQRETERVVRLRANDPGAAALLIPEVRQMWEALDANPDPQPNEVQEFIQTMLEQQADFDIAPAARAPIPKSWAVEIGRALSRMPEPTGRESVQEAQYNLLAQYNGLKAFFGDYTDEVIIHAISEYKGVSPQTADLISSYMTAIQGGGNPFRSLERAQDMDQVDSVSFWDWAGGLFRGGQGDTSGSGMSAEEMLRANPPEE